MSYPPSAPDGPRPPEYTPEPGSPYSYPNPGAGHGGPGYPPAMPPPQPPGFEPRPAAQGFGMPGQPAPPYSGPPYSGPPTSGMPASGMPTSGPVLAGPPPSGPPLSGPPMVGAPYPGPVGQPPRGGRATLVVSIVAALLFVLGGVMTVLFVSTNGRLDDTKKVLNAQVAAQEKTIQDDRSKIKSLETQLQAAKDELAEVEQTLTGTKNDRDRIEKEKAVISSCLNSLTDAISSPARDDKAGYDKAMAQVRKVCDEAERYLT